MNQLRKKLRRDLLANKAQVAAIVLVVALGIVMFCGPLFAQGDLRNSVDDILEKTSYEDFSASVESAPSDSVDKLGDLDNVSAVEGRLVGDVPARVDDSEVTLRVVSVTDNGRPSVNDLIVESGRYLEPFEEGACLVEHHLASEFDLGPESVVTIFHGSEEVPLEVAGSVVSPEFLRLVRSRTEYVTDPTQFGVIFTTYSEAQAILGRQGQVNNYVATVYDIEELDRTMEAAATTLEPYNLLGLTIGSEEPGVLSLNQDIENMGRLALFFAVLLLCVAALALYITMTQIVFSQQRQIGVSRALGYPGRVITRHYLGYGLVLGVAGSLAGMVGAYFLSRLFVHIYAGIYDLPMIRNSFYVWVAVVGVAVGLFFSIAGTLVPARHAVGMKPAEAMRTEAGLALSPPGTHHKPKVSRELKLPVWLRIAFRNLLRNRRRTVLTFLGVVATLCLLVTASGGKDSLDYSVDKYLNGVLRWDVAAAWLNPVTPDVFKQVGDIEGVVRAEPMLDAPARLVRGGESADVQVQAYPEDSQLHGDYPTPGSRARPGPGEIVLNRGITRKLPVQRGEPVTVTTSVGSLEFEVAGFVAEPFGGVAYVNLPYIQELITVATGVEDPFNAVVLEVSPGSEEEVVSALRRLPGVTYAFSKESLLSVFEELVGAIETLFVIFYVMAFSMGFAILFSMITVNILERRREIATIRTLGAGRWKIFSFLTTETMTVVVAAIVPGILLGRLLEWVVIERVLTLDRIVPDTVIGGVTVAIIVAAAIVVTLLSEMPSVRRLWRLDLARVTKERAD